MKRKMICSILLGLLLLSTIICVPARAETVASGTFGRSNLAMQWSVEENTLYITGNGYMDGFSMNDSRPWDPYRGQIQRIVMTGTIENVGYHAFEGCTELTEIVWPDGLKYIFDYAFSDCTSLKNVTIPEPVEIINEFAFNRCTALEVVTMSESVKKMAGGAFYECSALHTVTLSPKLREIGRWSFQRCKALKQIQLPATLQIVGDGAFRESGLVKIDIPERVQKLPGGVFWDCSNLEEVTFSSKSLELLGAQLFKDCSALTALHLPSDVATVYTDAFVGCNNLKSVCFHGDMPQLKPSFVDPIFLTFYYPEGNTTWKQEAISSFTEGNRGEVLFQSTVCQLLEKPIPEPTTEAPTEQLPTETMPPVTTESTESTEETLLPTGEGSDGVENPPNTPTGAIGEDNVTKPTDMEKDQPQNLLWVAVCISAVILLAAVGMVICVKMRKKA